MEAIKKIHHISAIVGHPQENLEFYRDVLGLRLIKQTVNFDDTGVYHLYFADENATPGTVITFFPWANAPYGIVGSGQVGTIAFRIPKGRLGEWEIYLNDQGIDTERTELFGKETLEFEDIHRLDLALVEGEEEGNNRDILGFHGAALYSSNPKETRNTLVDDMGLTELEEANDTAHFETAGDEAHHIVVPHTTLPEGVWGPGTVHHIAWSLPNSEVQLAWQEKLRDLGYGVTQVKDRNYFSAIYMRERGHVTFEFATDEPGFTVDEPLEELGQKLMLPPQYEDQRARFEQELPELKL